MTGGFPQPEEFDGPVPSRALGPWTHVTSRGIETGGEQPSGGGDGALASFFDAVATTVRMRKTLWVLVLKEFKSRYRAQALGLIWSFAHPLIMMATISGAFIFILHIKIPNFTVFYLIAAVFWQWFSNGAMSATGIFNMNSALVQKTKFPRYLLPLSAVLANGINFLLEWLLVVLFYFVFPEAYHFNYTLIGLIPLCLLMLVLLTGVGLMTAALHVRYRDVFYIVTSILTVGFWVSPVLYSTAMAPPLIRHILRFNPMAGVMEGARDILMRGQWPDPQVLLPGALTTFVLFVVGCFVFRSQNLALADHV